MNKQRKRLIKEFNKEVKEYLNTPRTITNCKHDFSQKIYLQGVWHKQCSKCTALKNSQGEIF